MAYPLFLFVFETKQPRILTNLFLAQVQRTNEMGQRLGLEVSTTEVETGDAYPPTKTTVSFKVNGYTNEIAHFVRVKIAMLMTHDLLAILIGNQHEAFTVEPMRYEDHFQHFMSQTNEDETLFHSLTTQFLNENNLPEKYAKEVANRQTLRDIYDWVGRAKDLYEKCIVTVSNYYEKNLRFNSAAEDRCSIFEALEADNTNIVIYSPSSEKTVVKKISIDALNWRDAIRTPCKRKGRPQHTNLIPKKYVNLKKIGLRSDHFVEKGEFEVLQGPYTKTRVYAMIPSFEIYAGMASEDALQGHNNVAGDMRCAQEDAQLYTMSFLFPCGRSYFLNRDGKPCVTNPLLYKTPYRPGGCDWPMRRGDHLDGECCVIGSDEKLLGTISTIYQRKTRNSTDYSFLHDLCNWHHDRRGPVPAHDTKLELIFPTPRGGDEMAVVKVFIALQPRVKSLYIHGRESDKPFEIWYNMVMKAIPMDNKQPILRLRHQHNSGKINRTILQKVLGNRPQEYLHVSLGRQYFEDIGRDLSYLLDEVYVTENFVFDLYWSIDGNIIADDRMDPCKTIVGNGFTEDEDMQDLNRPDGDDFFQDHRYFEKDHMAVSTQYTDSYILIKLVTKYKYS